jgi:gluconokinase
MILVLMGVAGCGKSTIAEQLAQRLGWDFAEGDALHSAASIAKMVGGHPLDDADRLPWLHRVAEWIDGEIAFGRSGVVTCSALKRSYRDILRRDEVRFVYLAVDRDVLAARIAARRGHFMGTTLLDSQLDTLELPGPDELGFTVDATGPPAGIIDGIISELGSA